MPYYKDMKRQIRTPYFEIGTKNYIYGDKVLEYAIALVASTHPEIEGNDVAFKYIRYGASPRAAQAIITAAKVRALMHGNYNVSYDDIDALAAPVLRHRIKLNYSAINDRLTTDDVIAMIVKETKKS